jgi:predicted ATPase
MEIVLAAAGIDEADSVDEARAKIARLLPQHDDTPLVLDRVSAAVGLSEGVGTAEETFWGVRKLLEALAAERPLVVVIDDTHWASPAMLDLIEYVTGWSGAAQIMLVCLARPELLEARPTWPTTIELEPLSDEESAQLLANLAPELDEPLRRRILDTSEGNPLYIEQLVALIGDEGEDVPIPPSIHALIAARLDRLQPDERAAIERGAVEGKVFHRSAVQYLTPDSVRATVPASLLTLVRKQLIGPDIAFFAGDDAFRFRNLVVRDAAYDAMPKQARADQHERLAGWIESVIGERVGEFDEILAYHLEQAHRYLAELGPLDEHGRALAERAAGLYASSAGPALGRGDFAAARFLYDRAVALYADDDPRRIALLPDLGAMLRESGDFDAAEAVFAEAETRGDERIAAHAALERTLMLFNTDPQAQIEVALRLAERVIPIFDAANDDVGLAKAWKVLAMRNWGQSQAGATTTALEHALTHARRAGNRAEELECLSWLAFSAVHGPTPVPAALQLCDDLLASGELGLEPSVLAAKAALVGMIGSFDESRELARRAVDAYAELGFRILSLATLQNAGRNELDAGDLQAAHAMLLESAEALIALGERGYACTHLAYLAEAAYRMDRLDEAEEHAQRALAFSAQEDLTAQVPARTIMAKVAAKRGLHAEAEALAREAIAQADTTDFLPVAGSAYEDFAQVLELGDKAAEARAALSRSLELFEQKGHVVGAERVRARLGATAPSPS